MHRFLALVLLLAASPAAAQHGCGSYRLEVQRGAEREVFTGDVASFTRLTDGEAYINFDMRGHTDRPDSMLVLTLSRFNGDVPLPGKYAVGDELTSPTLFSVWYMETDVWTGDVADRPDITSYGSRRGALTVRESSEQHVVATLEAELGRGVRARQTAMTVRGEFVAVANAQDSACFAVAVREELVPDSVERAVLDLGGGRGVPVVVGFAGHDWGATHEQVTAAEGEPTRTVPDGDLTLLWYEGREFLGEITDAVFYVHRRYGLIGGAYMAEFGRTGDGDCERVLRKFEEAVSQRFPGLIPVRNRLDSSLIRFCPGARYAAPRTVWEDPANGAMVVVEIAEEGRWVAMLYQSAQAEAVVRDAEQDEARRRF